MGPAAVAGYPDGVMKATTTHRTNLPAALGALILLATAAAAEGGRRTVIVMMKGSPASEDRLPSATLGGVKYRGYRTPAAALHMRAAARPTARTLAPGATNVRDLWIVGGYALDVTTEDVKTLSANPNFTVVENFEVRTPDVKVQSSGSGQPMENWGLDKIGAKVAWNTFGVTGRNVRIGHLDTGVDAGHPDLAGKIAAWAEFDGNGNTVNSSPHDSGIHGTHTAGILVGGSASGAPIGVAPGAKLLEGLVLNGTSGTLMQVLAGMQWVLDPDGDPNTDDGAQVLSMSLGAEGQYQIFEDITNQLVAAGVLPVFAVGNSGEGDVNAPANCSRAMAVGATMYSDSVASFSGGGRVAWNATVYTKPDIAAPGYGIPSSIPGGLYQTMSGTSMATPFVAGAAALLLEANPTLSVEQLRNALTSTARDLGDPGVDDRYGSGLLNVAAALAATTDRSVVQGITQGDGTPVPAAIQARDASGRIVGSARSDETTGQFQLSLPQGDYLLQASFGQSRGAQQSITVVKATVLTVNFSLGTSSALENLIVYPNPFRPSRDAAVTFDGLPPDTSVHIFTLSGRKVAEIASSSNGRVVWNGRADSGEDLASGPYFYMASRYDETKGWEHKKGVVAVLR
jgi:subtilisin family serine protease